MVYVSVSPAIFSRVGSLNEASPPISVLLAFLLARADSSVYHRRWTVTDTQPRVVRGRFRFIWKSEDFK